jgi:hypothetical protein
MQDENSFAITPISFFAVGWDCCYLNKKGVNPSFSTHLLPDTSHLCHEHAFAKVALGWNEEGLAFQIHVTQPHTQSFFPNIERGDSVELFIDTRDLKSAGFNTRFCHHFYFLPQSIHNHWCGEITHFRTEDCHPLCDPSLLSYEVKLGYSDYKMKIFIPSDCLYGYEPKQFDRLGFTYRINRAGGKPQHFAVTSKDYPIDQQPSLWGSLKLIGAPIT